MDKSTFSHEYLMLRTELALIRQNAGLTQRELAKRLKVPHSWVAKVETGERRIDLVEFCWFISACGLDPLPASEKLLRQFLSRPTGRRPKGGRSK